MLAGSVLATLAATAFILILGARSGGSAIAQTAPRPAGDRIFLKLEGIDGEVMETDHLGELSLQSFSWGISGSSAPGMKDLHVVMKADKAFPAVMRKAATGERIARAWLSMRNPIGQDYLKWSFGDLVVTSFQMDGAAGQGKPLVSFDLKFSKADVEYRAQLNNGGLGPAAKTSVENK